MTISTVHLDSRTQEINLTLLNTTAEDIGTYTCSVVNDEGMTNMTTELQVLGELVKETCVGFTGFTPFVKILYMPREVFV